MLLLKKSTASTEAGSTFQPSRIELLHSAANAFYAQASLHAQLIHVEWKIEKKRLLKIFIYFILCVCCFLLTLLFSGLLAIILSWDTYYRIYSIIFVISFFLLTTLVSIFQLRKLSNRSCDSFSATRREIASDIALIKSML